MICNDECKLEIDIDTIEDIYDSLSNKIYADMDKQYKEGKLNGATHATTWATLMQSVISSAIGAAVSLQTKESAMDRCVKQEQCDSSKATTARNDMLANKDIEVKDKDIEVKDKDIEVKNEQITSSNIKSTNETCIATAECSVKNEQIASSKASTIRNECLAQADCNLKDSQEAKVNYEVSNVLPKQIALTERQTEGFDDNIRQKLFEAQMNAWAMMFSSGLLESSPSIITSDEVSNLYSSMLP